MLQLAWADNANACAVQYAGTGALKTDFTRYSSIRAGRGGGVSWRAPLIKADIPIRTGKRTRWGLLMDGWNSVIRYYKNNFSDGFRQVGCLWRDIMEVYERCSVDWTNTDISTLLNKWRRHTFTMATRFQQGS